MCGISREVVGSAGRVQHHGILIRRGIPLVLVVFVVLTSNVTGQEPRVRGGQDRGTTTRTIPDALKFANGLFRQRKYDLAAEEYDRFLSTNPTGPDRTDALFGLGNARLYQGRHAEARRAL